MALPSVSSLAEHFQLKEGDLAVQISDRQLDEISRSYCRQWKTLRSELGMERIVENDIDRNSTDEEKKRRDLLYKWKEVMGSAATPKALIGALLEIKCREDAEGVCKLLQQRCRQGILYFYTVGPH